MSRSVFWKFAILILFTACFLTGPLSAGRIVDQQQPGIDLESGTLGIGGDVQQRLAQSITAGVDGRLAEIQLPIACFPVPAAGTLILEIVELDDGVPSNRVLSRVEVAGTAFPEPSEPEFRSIALTSPVPMLVGQRFAITLANPTGECWLSRGTSGDPYPPGEGFFTNLNDDPDWILMKSRPEPSKDLVFKTVVDVPDAGGSGEFGLCTVRGLEDPVPIPSFTPLCRCLEDDALQEQRCALVLPSMILVRRIPLPIQAGAPITVQWTLMPLERLVSEVRVEDLLPDDFLSTSSRLLFATKELEPGQSLTLKYDAVGGFSQGQFEMKSSIHLGSQDGSMDTVLEVAGKQ